MPTLETVTGIKVASLIGGVIGSFTALSYLAPLTGLQRWIAFGSGLGCAAYIPPLASYYLSMPSSLDGPLGFVAGVAGMGLVGAAVALSRDPISTWRKLRGKTGGGDAQ